MVMRGASSVVLILVLAGAALATKENGLPRPTGYPDLPTTDYGPLPPCYNATTGAAVTCDWYGFSYFLYPTLGASCNAGMRAALSNTTRFPPGSLLPYTYYYSDYYIFDPITNDTYCLYGCFNMGASAAAPPPESTTAPPPVALNYPPPSLLAPPPTLLASPPPPVLSAPPPVLSTPPPATLFTPPPAGVTTPSPPPPAGVTPAPPLPKTRVINLNGAGFLRPTGFVSFVLSAALLILNGLAAF